VVGHLILDYINAILKTVSREKVIGLEGVFMGLNYGR
jgi:hypothetical protein